MDALQNAENLFWEGALFVVDPTPNLRYTEKLLEAGKIWRAEQHFLAAGLATSAAQLSAQRFGLPYFVAVSEWFKTALDDYSRCLERESANSLVPTLALMKAYQELLRFSALGRENSLRFSRLRKSVMITLADEMLTTLNEHPKTDRLWLEGFRIEGSMLGPWSISTEDDVGTYNFFDAEKRIVSYRIDSAFELLIAIGDYAKAESICKRFSSAITTNQGLRGWYAAIQGFLYPQSAAEYFFAAATYFEGDEPDVMRLARSMSELANKHTWSTHFKMRGHLALAAMDESNFERHIMAASNMASKFKSIHIPSVRRLDSLVIMLAQLLEGANSLDPAEARDRFWRDIMLNEEPYDETILEFIDNTITGLSELDSNRKRGLAKIGRALAALERLPLIGESNVDAFAITLDLTALKVIEGKLSNWIHRSLGEISSEIQLQKILLRLFQNQIPKYAQLRHGPMEYGKDIVVCVSESGTNILRMYQIKCGDITKRKWNQECRPQLEEIFQVPISDEQIGHTIDRQIGILAFNGHFSPFVERIINAWKTDQFKAFGRQYEFMNLDTIVNYVIDNRLTNALRVALKEYGNETHENI